MKRADGCVQGSDAIGPLELLQYPMDRERQILLLHKPSHDDLHPFIGCSMSLFDALRQGEGDWEVQPVMGHGLSGGNCRS